MTSVASEPHDHVPRRSLIRGVWGLTTAKRSDRRQATIVRQALVNWLLVVVPSVLRTPLHHGRQIVHSRATSCRLCCLQCPRHSHPKSTVSNRCHPKSLLAGKMLTGAEVCLMPVIVRHWLARYHLLAGQQCFHASSLQIPGSGCCAHAHA